MCTAVRNVLPWTHRSPQPERHLDRFSRFYTAYGRVHMLYNGSPLYPQNCAYPYGSGAPGSNSWFLGPVTRVHHPNGISIDSAVFAGLTIMTDRPTDRPRFSVCNIRPHLRRPLRTYYAVLRCGFKNHVLHGGTHWHHLANTIEPSMCRGDAAFLSNYFDHLCNCEIKLS